MTGSITQRANSSLQRGQLRFEVQSSKTTVEAGSEFSLSVNITNPYDVPIVLRSVSTKLPVEFVNTSDAKIREQRESLEREIRDLLKQRVPALEVPEDHKRQAFENLAREIFRVVPIIGGAIATGTAAVEYVKASNVAAVANIDRVGSTVSTEDVKAIVDAARQDDDPAKRIREEMIAVLEKKTSQLRQGLERAVVLHPGNSTVQVFTLVTRQWLFFRPSTYTLHIEINYEVEGVEHRDVVNHSLVIASSMRSLVIGGGTGAAVGYLAKSLIDARGMATLGGGIPSALVLIGNVLLGIVAVVIFSRKADAQPIMAVQDIWGSILVGFLVGYAGTGFFESLLPDAGSSGP